MADHPNAALMRRATEAFSKGDITTLKQIIAEDAVWHVPGRSQVAGDYRGHDQIFGYFAKLMELTGGTFKVDLHDVLATDDHVINLDRMTASRGDKTLDMDLVLVVHPKDGKIAEAWDLFSDQYGWDDFWS